MNNLNNLLQELGISKVRLAKYLGVSRQMVYNYLELDSFEKWPSEKKILLYKLLGIEDNDDGSGIEKITVSTEYLLQVEDRLSDGIKEKKENEYLDLKGLKKEEHNLASDLTFLIKEKLGEDSNRENYYILQYTYHMLQSIPNVPEIKYLLAYLSKLTGFTPVNTFKFDEDQQFIFEGIVHSAFTLYNNGAASKTRVADSRNRFVQEMEAKNEEKLSRTQQLNTDKIQALKELGYDSLTPENAVEVFEKIAEIQTRSI